MFFYVNISSNLGLSNKGSVQLLGDYKVEPQHSFDAGGVCSKNESQKSLSTFLYGKIQTENLICLLLNECAQKGDPGLESDIRVFFVGSEVFHALDKNAKLNEIYETIRDAETSLNSIGFLFPQGRATNIFQEKDISSETIQIAISQIQYLFMGVYDGECYFIWSRCNYTRSSPEAS